MVAADPHGAGGEDQEFVDAIRAGAAGLTSVVGCLPVMRIIDQVQRSIDGRRKLASRL